MHRRRTSHEGTWALSYGDMITLLLGFFVLFFSLEKPQEGNVLLSKSLMMTLEKLDDDVSRVPLEDGVTQQAPTQEGVNKGRGMARDDSSEDATSDRGNTDSGDSLFTQIGKQFKSILSFIIPMQSSGEKKFNAKTPPPRVKKIESNLPFVKDPDGRIELSSLQAEAIRQDDKIYVTFPKISFFDSASIDLTEEGASAIKKFTEAYLPFAGTMQLHIVGFSDKRQVRPGVHRFKDNLELSVLRAVSAQRIISKVGVPNAKTRLLGHGVNIRKLPGENPVTVQEKWALARKIMFIIEPGKNR